MMRRFLPVLMGIAVSLVVTVNAVATKGGGMTTRTQRGAYLVRVLGCGDCHTPMKFDSSLDMPVPDMSRLLSGHPSGAPDPGGTLGQGDTALFNSTSTAIKQPFGIVYAANITPDRQTGIGTWSEKDFVATMRTGKHLGSGRQILPPMPWLDIAGADDDDLGAIYAYLKSIPAISNAVLAPKVEPKAIEAMEKSFQKLLKEQPKQ